MNKRIYLALLQSLSIASGMGWALTSHKYDCFNVGPCRGNVDFWTKMGEIASYAFVGSWVVLLAYTFLRISQVEGVCAKAIACCIAIVLPPAALFVSSWLFNFGITGAQV